MGARAPIKRWREPHCLSVSRTASPSKIQWNLLARHSRSLFYFILYLVFVSYCMSFLSCYCDSVSDHQVLLLLINLIWFDFIWNLSYHQFQLTAPDVILTITSDGCPQAGARGWCTCTPAFWVEILHRHIVAVINTGFQLFQFILCVQVPSIVPSSNRPSLCTS